MPIPQRHGNEVQERLRNLILKHTGIVFSPVKKDEFVNRISEAAENAGCEDLEQYYLLLLEAGNKNKLWADLISEITVRETYFFRDPCQMSALREHILPDLISRHQHDRRLRIWSAGCATGEEPYSVAILLLELLSDFTMENILILATDIDKHALQQAGKGLYRDWSFRQIDSAVRERYFTQREQWFELDPSIRDMVTFSYLNLVEDTYPCLFTNTMAMDLILCRNVSMYLQKTVVRQMAERFHNCLQPGGWLMVSAVETNDAMYDGFEARHLNGTTIYKKPGFPSIQIKTRASAEPKVEKIPPVAPPSPPANDISLHEQPLEPRDIYKKALDRLALGCLEEAIDCLQSCVLHDPDFIPAYYMLARIHANRGQLKEARLCCQQALGRDPLMTEAYYVLALIHQEEGALEEAISQLKKALYLDAGFALAHFSLAGLYQRLGRRDEESRHRTRAIRLAADMAPDQVMPGSDGLTAARMLKML